MAMSSRREFLLGAGAMALCAASATAAVGVVFGRPYHSPFAVR